MNIGTRFIPYRRLPDPCSLRYKRAVVLVLWALCIVLLATPTWGQALHIYRSHFGVIEGEGGENMYSIMLRSQPTADVTVTLTSQVPPGPTVTITPTTLIFTTNWSTEGSGGWDEPQMVTVASIQDDKDFGNVTVTITHAVASEDARYDGIATTFLHGRNSQSATAVTVTVYDDDVSNVTITPASFDVWENDDHEYTVALDTEPMGDVTVTLASPTGLAVAPTAPLTFTTARGVAGGWNTAQTVTVSTGDDADSTNETRTIGHAVTSANDAAYNALADREVVVNVLDDDVVVISHSALELDEGSVGSYTVQLRSRPSATVTVAVTMATRGTNPATAMPTTLEFTTTNWNRPQSVRITGTRNDAVIGDETLTITHQATSTDPRYNAARARYVYQDGNDMNTDAAELTIAIDDNEGIFVAPTEVAMEHRCTAHDPSGGPTDHIYTWLGGRYEMRLMGPPPSANVTVTPSASPDGVVQLSTGRNDNALVFTPTNYQAAQTVTVVPRENEYDTTVTVTHAPLGSEGYSSAAIMPVRIVIGGRTGPCPVDEFFPGLIISTGVMEVAVVSVPLDGSDTYRIGETIRIRVSFSADVRVTGTPQLNLRVGSDDRGDQSRLADLVDIPTWPKNELLFEYTVQPGDSDSDGIETAAQTNANRFWELDPGDGIIDGYDGPYAGPILVHEKYRGLILTNAKIDASDVEAEATHVVVASTPEAGSDTYHLGEAIEIRVSFSSPVRVTGTPQLRLIVGDEERLASLDETPTGPVSALLFEYVVQPGDRDGDGIETGDDPWKLDAGDAIIDNASGNAAMVPDAYKGFTLTSAKIDTPTVRARAGDDQRVMEQDAVTLDGRGSSASEGVEIASYQWRAAAGNDVDVVLANADEAVATFTLPNLPSPVVLTFVLTVTGDRGQTDADEVVVEVDATNNTPKADPGDSRDEQEGTEVTLDGSGSSDPEGEQLRYAWRLKSGGSSYVTMPSDLTTAWIVVTLGVNIPDETELTFELKVTDPGDASHAADVVIKVRSTPFGEVLSHALSRFGRALGSSAVDTLGERFNNTSRRPPGTVAVNVDGTQLNLADGRRQGAAHIAGSPPDTSTSDAAMPGPLWADHFDERLRTGSRHLPALDRNFLMRSDFEIGLGGDDKSEPDRVGADRVGANLRGAEGSVDWAFWGRFDSRSFEAMPTEAVALDGSVSVGYLGADARFGADGETIIGLALARAGSDVAFRQDGLEGDISLGMLGFYPYGGWSPSEAVSLWGMLGAGSGEAELTTDEEHELATDIGMMMLAGGGRGDLRPVGMVNLAVTGDAYLVNTEADGVANRALKDIETNVQRLRVGLEGSLQLPVNGASMLRPSIALSGRVDGGDAETGFGVEVNASIAYENAMGWTLDGRMRQLLTHTDDGIAETAFSAMLRYDPGGPGGPSIALMPTWGDTQSVTRTMWHGDQPMFGGLPGTSEYNGASASRTRSLNAELQYGIPLRSWMIAPYGTLNMHGASDRERWGVRIEALALPRGNLSADLFGERPDGRRGAAIDPGVQATVRLLLD